MDYQQLSDFEINKRVAIATGHKKFNDLGWQGTQEDSCSAVIVRGPTKIGAFDPCNNPADAWPIIEKYRISFLDQLTEWCVGAKGVSPIFDTRPLRAAMIVFLLMQEKKSEETV